MNAFKIAGNAAAQPPYSCCRLLNCNTKQRSKEYRILNTCCFCRQVSDARSNLPRWLDQAMLRTALTMPRCQSSDNFWQARCCESRSVQGEGLVNPLGSQLHRQP